MQGEKKETDSVVNRVFATSMNCSGDYQLVGVQLSNESLYEKIPNFELRKLGLLLIIKTSNSNNGIKSLGSV